MKYQEIAQQIKDEIIGGTYKADEKLPTEIELCKIYNTSKMTMRKAISLLIRNGIIFSIPRNGYYVNSKEDIIKYNALVSGSIHFMNQYNKLKNKVISFKEITPNEFLQKKFKINKNQNVFFITRIRFIDDKLHCAENIYIPKHFVPNITINDIEDSIYRYIESQGHVFGTNKKSISASNMPKDYVKYMHNKDLPILQVENTGFLYNGECFEYSISFMLNQEVGFITEYNSILR